MADSRRRKRRNKKFISQLKADVQSHVDKDAGISNTLLERFGRNLCSEDFLGVFSADTIPQRQLIKRGRFIVIINLGEKKGKGDNIPVGHFVTVCADPSRLQYLDPYGLPCLQPRVRSFVSQCNRPVYENLQQLQTLKSNYCGFYCLLFALYLDRVRNRSTPRFALKFDKHDLKKNDSLCMKYLKRLM